MHQFSRALYRALESRITTPTPGSAAERKVAVLSACEAVVMRIATQRNEFENPTRKLLKDIRPYFDVSALADVQAVIKVYLRAAQRFAAEHPREAFAAATGTTMKCRGTTRKGADCKRTPLDNGYCPSHQHLVEPEHGVSLVT